MYRHTILLLLAISACAARSPPSTPPSLASRALRALRQQGIEAANEWLKDEHTGNELVWDSTLGQLVLEVRDSAARPAPQQSRPAILGPRRGRRFGLCSSVRLCTSCTSCMRCTKQAPL